MLSSKGGSGTGKEANFENHRMRLRRTATVWFFPSLLVLTIRSVWLLVGFAQSGAQAMLREAAAAARSNLVGSRLAGSKSAIILTGTGKR